MDNDLIGTIYEVLVLNQRQEGGQPLSAEEVVTLQSCLAALSGERFGRQYRRLDLKISARLHSSAADTADALVQVLDLSPGGMRIDGCPALEAGTSIEMHLRENEHKSYRFPATIMWIRDHEEHCMAGLRFTGAPIEQRHETESKQGTEQPEAVAG